MQNTILNLTQHQATQDQLDAGVFEPSIEVKEQIKNLLTFDSSVLTDPALIRNRVAALVQLVKDEGAYSVMLGGAPFFMGPLANALTEAGVEVVFSFTDRVSVDVKNEDGTITKTSVFKHLGFVPHVF